MRDGVFMSIPQGMFLKTSTQNSGATVISMSRRSDTRESGARPVGTVPLRVTEIALKEET